MAKELCTTFGNEMWALLVDRSTHEELFAKAGGEKYYMVRRVGSRPVGELSNGDASSGDQESGPPWSAPRSR